jgi:alanyl-tRNA synthetase
MGGGGAAAQAVEIINGVQFQARVLKGVATQDLKGLADEAKIKLGSGIVTFVAVSDDGKGAVVVAVTADLTSRFNAVELVKIGAAILGGKGGGGKPDMAQAGGPDGAKADEAVAAVKAALTA